MSMPFADIFQLITFSGILYAAYRLLFRKESSFAVNRIFIITALAISSIVPFVNWPLSEAGDGIYSVLLSPVTPLFSPSGWAPSNPGILWFAGYLVVSVFLAIRLAQRLLAIAKLKSDSKKILYRGCRVYVLPASIQPFSFFNSIFISQRLYESAQREIVLKHEAAHARLSHSIDVLLFELAGVLLWFNPFLWLFRHEIVAVHEYQADRITLAGYDNIRGYQSMLLNSALGRPIPLGNTLSRSVLNKRFKMMSVSKHKKPKIMKYLFFLPVFVLTSLFFACEAPLQPTTVIDSQGEEVDRVIDQMPVYPGGMEALAAFVQDELQYPEEARAEQATGTVFVSFVVEKDGAVSSVKPQRSTIAFGCEEEAVRVVSIMPDWQPAKKDGQPVKMEMTLPIKFEL